MTNSQSNSAQSSSSNSGQKSPNKTLFWTGAITALLSIGIHAYLLVEHYALRYGGGSASSICNINEMFSCATVSASRYSEFMGLPMALLGVMANVVLLLLVLWHPLTDEASKRVSRISILLVASGIAATSVVMASISAFAIGKYCPFCIGAYVLSFASLGFLFRGIGSPAAGEGKRLARPLGLADFKVLLGLAGGAFALSFMINDQFRASYGWREMGDIVNESISGWLNSADVTIQTVEPLALGPDRATAKMTIVEFADFRCPHCKHAAPTLKAFVESHPDVRLEFQVWPLDGECNTSIRGANGASCLLARSVYCAEKLQKKGWIAHELIFERQEEFSSRESVVAALPDIAHKIGSTPESLTACTDASETKEAVEKQAAVGSDLKLSGTPAIYVNGRQLTGGQFLPVLAKAHSLISESQTTK